MSTRINVFLLLGLMILISACEDKKESLVVLETPFGEMTAILFDETPQHKENFLHLVQNGSYDSVLFHRVIKDFMIQTGDVATGVKRQAVDYTLPAEFVPDKFIHRKGVLAAARVGDARNPEKRSSGSQFYIVDGDIFNEEGLEERAKRRQYLKLYGFFDRMLKSKRFPTLTEKYYYHVNKLEEDSTYDFYTAQESLIFQSQPIIEKEFGAQADPGYSDWVKKVYASEGGAPHLDGEYTVFGQVIDGLDVIDQIAALQTDARDKPVNDVRMQVRILKLSKDEIERKYNYEFPTLAK